MDNLQYLANAELDQAALKTFTEKAVSFEVASALVTVAGQNGTEVKVEGVSQDEFARNGTPLDTREVANVGDSPAAGKYARRDGGGPR
jgi:hypothetical protein